MPKQYFFQVGSFRELSLAEIYCVFDIYHLNRDILHHFFEDIYIVKSNDIAEETLLKIFNRLGGSIRIGYIIEDLDTFLNEYIQKGSKVTFGLSIFGRQDRDDFRFLKRLGNEIKGGFKESKIPSRFIFPKERELNAAQLINNNVFEKGFELCILRNETEEIYGRTLQIQDMQGYVKRDTHRPYSDIDMGVLPPKLARIMVNLAGIKEGIIWDPFCGSGTILMESAVLGYNFLGSDIDENAIYHTEENIKWLNNEGDLGNVVYEVFKMDVHNPEGSIIKKLKNTNISAIICEPFMGPPQKRVVSQQKADELLESVKSLYTSLISIIDDRMGLRDINMVLIIPSYKTDTGWKTFGIRDILSNRWEVLNSKYSPKRDLKWSRKNSIITRNIFILHRT